MLCPGLETRGKVIFKVLKDDREQVSIFPYHNQKRLRYGKMVFPIRKRRGNRSNPPKYAWDYFYLIPSIIVGITRIYLARVFRGLFPELLLFIYLMYFRDYFCLTSPISRDYFYLFLQDYFWLIFLNYIYLFPPNISGLLLFNFPNHHQDFF